MNTISVVYIGLFLSIIINLFNVNFCSADEKFPVKEINAQKMIKYLEDMENRVVLPGEKPITLSDDLLNIIVPELKNPRIMTYADNAKYNQEPDLFLEECLSFVLARDFNKDGIGDIAFCGTFQLQDSNRGTFLAIITIKRGIVLRQFLLIDNVDPTIYNGASVFINSTF